jgi:hypothetical protein
VVVVVIIIVEVVVILVVEVLLLLVVVVVATLYLHSTGFRFLVSGVYFHFLQLSFRFIIQRKLFQLNNTFDKCFSVT